MAVAVACGSYGFRWAAFGVWGFGCGKKGTTSVLSRPQTPDPIPLSLATDNWLRTTDQPAIHIPAVRLHFGQLQNTRFNFRLMAYFGDRSGFSRLRMFPPV